MIKKYYKLILWSLVIGYLCFAPANEFKRVHITIPYFDKIVHFGLFFVLGILLWALKYFEPTRIHSLLFPLLAALYGGFIEIIQYCYIIGRSGDFFDWFADILGLVIAIWLFYYLPEKVKKILG